MECAALHRALHAKGLGDSMSQFIFRRVDAAGGWSVSELLFHCAVL